MQLKEALVIYENGSIKLHAFGPQLDKALLSFFKSNPVMQEVFSKAVSEAKANQPIPIKKRKLSMNSVLELSDVDQSKNANKPSPSELQTIMVWLMRTFCNEPVFRTAPLVSESFTWRKYRVKKDSTTSEDSSITFGWDFEKDFDKWSPYLRARARQWARELFKDKNHGKEWLTLCESLWESYTRTPKRRNDSIHPEYSQWVKPSFEKLPKYIRELKGKEVVNSEPQVSQPIENVPAYFSEDEENDPFLSQLAGNSYLQKQ